MVTVEQLRHFLAVVEHGTLTAAADELHLSQPALSRSMQRFERAFPSPLFERSANQVAITEAGELAAVHARRVLAELDEMHAAVAELDRRRRTIDVVSCAPAPLWRLLPRIEAACPGLTITSRLGSLDEVSRALAEGEVHVGISTEPPPADVPGFRCGVEHLFLSVPPAHPAAALPGIRLDQLDGETMLLHSRIGFWAELVRSRMPRAHFLVQEPDALVEIARTSSLPVFSTDLALAELGADPHRVQVPVLDEQANPTYWCHLSPRADERLLRLARTIGTRGLWRN